MTTETNSPDPLSLYSLIDPRGALIIQNCDDPPLPPSTPQPIDLPEDPVVEFCLILSIESLPPYLTIEKWLGAKRERGLALISDDVKVLKAFLETEQAEALLTDGRFSLFLTDTSDALNATAERLAWRYCQHSWHFLPKENFSQEITETLLLTRHLISETVAEYLDHGVPYYSNFYRNLFELPGSYLGHELFESFKNVPAIICGAGPSLGRHYETLSKLGNRALVFAGGSSLLALSRGGVTPHFAAGIDPNSPQYQRLINHTAFDLPFFFRNRLYTPALRAVHGPKLYLCGAGGYDTAEWVERNLGFWEDEERAQRSAELCEGHNIVNFLTSIAHALGCSPILYVGLDLAYTGEQAYSPEVVTTDQVAKSDSKLRDSENSSIVTCRDLSGQLIRTERKWLLEAEWISEFTSQHPDCRFFNATEGGMPIKGVENVSLNECLETHCTAPPYSIKERITELLSSLSPISTDPKQIDTLLGELRESLEQCHALSDLSLCELAASLADPKILYPTPQAFVAEFDLREEMAYTSVLDIFNRMDRQLSYEERESFKRVPKEVKKAQTLAMKARHHAFLRETASTQIALIDRARAEAEELGTVTEGLEIVEERSPSGGLLALKSTRNGILDGDQLRYATDGRLSSLIPYRAGKIDGEVKLWHPNGQLHRLIHFREGRKEGVEKIWYCNGQLELEAQYREDVLVNNLTRFTPGGVKTEEIRFHTHPGHYDVRKWNAEGKLMLECLYSPEEPMQCLYREWDAEGELRCEREGFFDGESIRWREER